MKKIFFMLLLLFLSIKPAHAAEWLLQYNPDPDPNANQIRAVWGPSGTEVFSVGDYGTILHTIDNGTSWSTMTSGISQTIYGVWGSSASNVFAVADQGKIVLYNGSIWSAMTSSATKRLRDVWGTAANNVFAVGEDGYILHYDGISWSPMTSPTTLTLQAVWGTAANNVYAVGGPSGSATGTGVIIKYEGSTWTEIYTDPTIVRFHGVWGSSDDDVFVVGQDGSILHTTDAGLNWSAIPNPVQDSTVTLRNIWGTSASDIYVVGEGSLAGYGGSIILHYDGSNWNVMNNPISSLPSPANSSSGIKLHGVWGSASDNVFAVGETYIEEDGITRHGTILHYTEPLPTSSTTSMPTTSVSSSSSTTSSIIASTTTTQPPSTTTSSVATSTTTTSLPPATTTITTSTPVSTTTTTTTPSYTLSVYPGAVWVPWFFPRPFVRLLISGTNLNFDETTLVEIEGAPLIKRFEHVSSTVMFVRAWIPPKLFIGRGAKRVTVQSGDHSYVGRLEIQ